jgi:hypothetical protein
MGIFQQIADAKKKFHAQRYDDKYKRAVDERNRLAAEQAKAERLHSVQQQNVTAQNRLQEIKQAEPNKFRQFATGLGKAMEANKSKKVKPGRLGKNLAKVTEGGNTSAFTFGNGANKSVFEFGNSSNESPFTFGKKKK